MSTKTTFKRIALVAVAALGLGVLTSVAPASAAVSAGFNFVTAESSSNTTDTAVHVAGLSNYVEIISVADTAGATRLSLTGAGATFVDITEETDADADWSAPAVTYNTAATVASIASGDILGTDAEDTLTFRISTPTAGTVTIKVDTVAISGGIETVTDAGTLTVTVNSAASAGSLSVANSTSLLDADATAAGSYSAPTADEAVSAAKAAGTVAGVAKLTLNDVNAVAMPNTTSVTAVVSGPGSVSLNSTLASATYATGGRVDSGTTTSGVIYAAFYADGNSGVSTITFSVGTTVVATETVTFYGAVSTLAATAVKYSLADSASATAFVTLTAKDSNGVAVPLANGDGAPTTTNGVFTDADGVDAFKVSVLLDPAADTLGTKSTTWTHTASGVAINLSVVVSEALATGTQVLTLSVDKAQYAPGEKVTVTVSAVDASGNIMADGAGNYFTTAGVTSSASLQGSLPGQSVTLANGFATYTVYAPLVSGPVTLTGTSAATAATVVSATFNVKADTTVADAIKALEAKIAADKAEAAAAKVIADAKAAADTAAAVAAAKKAGEDAVAASQAAQAAAVEAAQAATDAAAEATDAANAATDAANASAEAGDAATAAAQDAADAVAALSVQVNEQIDAVKAQNEALRKQLVALTNLIIKIQKKVKA